MPSSTEPENKSRWRWLRRGACVVFLLLIAGYVFFTGPRDLARYPQPGDSPYRLPWPAGVERKCIQSNRGIVSHRGHDEFAFDFAMPVGSDVCAARGGIVENVVVSHDGHGANLPNNYISINHGDGTEGRYLHLEKDGSLVRRGDRVVQGQIIARSGHVGRSLTPHLHFSVRKDTDIQSIPISFVDVARHAGVPRLGFWYTSGNMTPR